MIIIAALLGFFLVSYFHKLYMAKNFNDNHWQKNISASLKFSDEAITEGDESNIQIIVTNHRFMPLPAILFKFRVDSGISFIDNENSSISDKNYIRHVFTLMSYQRITRNSKIYGKLRGYYKISDLDIVVNNFTENDSHVFSVPNEAKLYVFPARSKYAEQIMIPFNQIMGQTLLDSIIYEDPFEFRGIRPYQTFDTIKKVNWKASAKVGELMVNQFYDTTKKSVVILLNLEEPRCLDSAFLLEESIRITRTLMEMFSANGILVDIFTNAKDVERDEEIFIHSCVELRNISYDLTTLARIDLSKKMRNFKSIIDSHCDDSTASYLVISANTMDSVCESFNKLVELRPNAKWLVPIFTDSTKIAKQVAGDVHYLEVERS